MTLAATRGAVSDAATTNPRHAALAAAVIGLLIGPHVPLSVAALVALAVLVAARVLPLARRRAPAVALGVLVVAGALLAQSRTAALDRTALRPLLGHTVAGDATVLSAPRGDAFGGRRALVRWQGERVLLRLRGGIAPPAAVGDELAVRGSLRPPDRAAVAVHAHATLRAFRVAVTGRRRGGVAGALDAVRRRAEAALQDGLPAPEAALLRGMVLGEDDALPDDLRDDFRASGLSHLVRCCK